MGLVTVQGSIALPDPGVSQPNPYLVRKGDHVETVDQLRGAPGPVVLRRYRYNQACGHTNFVCFEIPPGAAEGLHVHYADDRNGTGSYDEFYYIISGRGIMTVGDTSFEVAAGDGIHAPLDLARGVANADPDELLRVHLTFVLCEPGKWPESP
jgi:mannose-6-phosphate isomerase-like protein (cupin superfamily)